METKKSHSADLNRKRPQFFLLGLVVSLTLLAIALEYNAPIDSYSVDESLLNDIPEEMESFHAQQPDMQPAARHAAAPKASSIINKVDETVETTLSDNNAIGEDSNAESSANGNGQPETSDNTTTATAPVAVDMNDNPLNFQVVERLPEFPGGMVELMKWLTRTLKYPEFARQHKQQGRVMVSFIINKDGTIANPKIVQSVSAELDREALRVVRAMPAWKPGEDRGKPCRTLFCLPIVFKLS